MTDSMGKVITRIRVENWLDSELAAVGARQEKPRTIETDALVDTRAVKFYLKRSLIQQLGLRPIGEIKSRTMSAQSETPNGDSIVSPDTNLPNTREPMNSHNKAEKAASLASLARSIERAAGTPGNRMRPGALGRLLACAFAIAAGFWPPISAQAQETIQISINAGPNGSVDPHGDLTVPANTDFGPIVATPDLGYQIEDWYIDGEHAGWDTLEIWLHNGDADVDVYVAFQRMTNRVAVTVGNGGTLQPGDNGTTLFVPWGDSITFTAQPEPTYHVDTWRVDGAVKQVGGTSFTLSHVTAEHSLAVDFAVDTFSVMSRAGPHGTVDPEGVVSVGQGNNQPFTAIADNGFSLAGWLLDRVLVQTGPYGYVLGNVQTNHIVQPLFGRPISCGQTVTNDLLSAEDPDAWLFTGQAGDQLTLTLAASSSNLAPALEFYSLSGELLARSGSGTATLTLTNSDDFLIVVHDAQYANSGQYVLSVRSSACEEVPTLTIEKAGQSVLLSWPVTATGYTLEATTSLEAASPIWTEIPPPYSSGAASNYVTEPLTAAKKFYRLQK